ncbi:replicative DNA helicase [Mesobacillus maritimus]|uniref:replicative DNA helicase n=1 Tax=Mesobacillus maritimus TaxID=1643336 RepID=UPI00203F5B72|nr:replicative DNA helicase [Mesobacillus maritimus]
MINSLVEENQYLPGYQSGQQDDTLYAENMILGAILLDPKIIFELILEPDHFSMIRNRLIFGAMVELRQESRPIDPITILDKLGSEIENVGGVSYITSLAVSCPTTAHVEEHQRIVIENYKIRKLKKGAAFFLNNASMEEAERFYQTYIQMQEIGLIKQETKQDLIMEIYDDLYEDKGEFQGIDTGYLSLNKMTSGWNKGDLIILAARPSMGKTAFALSLASKVCEKGGVVDIFSLEMPKKQLALRMLSSITRIDGAKWKNPYRYFNEEDQGNANQALEIFYKWNLQIQDQSRQTLSDLRAQIQKTKREYPNEEYLVVIDYLQLITITGKHDRHDLAVGSITSGLKQIARQYEVPIILLSQLSRGVEQRMDKRPRLSDLRDSGNIEQDADLVMMLYRDEYYNKENEGNNILEVDIVKQRNGPVGVVKFLFEKEIGRFIGI